MAEGAIKAERQSQVISQSEMTRRKFLGIVGKTAAVGAAAGVVGVTGIGALELGRGVTKGIDEAGSREAEAKFKPKKILAGKALIRKGPINELSLSARRKPEIDENVVPWKNIIELNGVNVQETNEFTIENAPVVEGRNPENTRSETSDWLTVKAKVRNAIGAEAVVNLYMNLSYLTADFIETKDTRIIDLDKVSDDVKKKMGIVKPPEKKAT